MNALSPMLYLRPNNGVYPLTATNPKSRTGQWTPAYQVK